MALPDDYEKLAALTRAMLDAARKQNWDELTAIGPVRDRLVATLPQKLPSMPANDRVRITRAIEEILASHSEIADRAGPWMEHTARLLAALRHADDAHASAPIPNNR